MNNEEERILIKFSDKCVKCNQDVYAGGGAIIKDKLIHFNCYENLAREDERQKMNNKRVNWKGSTCIVCHKPCTTSSIRCRDCYNGSPNLPQELLTNQSPQTSNVIKSETDGTELDGDTFSERQKLAQEIFKELDKTLKYNEFAEEDYISVDEYLEIKQKYLGVKE